MELHIPDREILISNCTELSARMLNLLLAKELSDVQLQVGKHTFDTHKLILCSGSDVFKTMLTSQKWLEANKHAIVLIEEPMCEPVFEKFIQYIYCGQLYLSHSTVGPLLMLADKYNVKEMVPLCRSYMLKHLDASCVLQWWQIANMSNDSDLAAAILSFIECNFDTVISSPDFTNASLDTVEKLFSSSRLVTRYEAYIFFSAFVWLRDYLELRHPTVYEAKEAFRRLVRHIRWPMMNKDEILWLREHKDVREFIETNRSFLCLEDTPPGLDPYMLIVSPTTEDNVSSNSVSQYYESCDSLLDISNDRHFSLADNYAPYNSFFSASQENNYLKPKSKGKKIKKNKAYMPRVYCSDYWCTRLTISNFLAFPQYATQTFFFSTPQTGDRHENSNALLDWEVELSPKGVRFSPAVLIGLVQDGNRFIEETYIHTVRLSVMSRSPQELPLKVQVNILVQVNNPSTPGSFFFEKCQRHTCIFDSRNQRHNFDDIVPYENFGSYLHPEGIVTDLYPTQTLAFTLFVVIQPSV